MRFILNPIHSHFKGVSKEIRTNCSNRIQSTTINSLTRLLYKCNEVDILNTRKKMKKRSVFFFFKVTILGN